MESRIDIYAGALSALTSIPLRLIPGAPSWLLILTCFLDLWALLFAIRHRLRNERDIERKERR